MWPVFLRKNHEFRNKLNWIILKIEGHAGKKYISHKYSNKWTKIGLDIGICLGNNQGNFQLHMFTIRENTAKSFRATFLTHTVECSSLKNSNEISEWLNSGARTVSSFCERHYYFLIFFKLRMWGGDRCNR